MQAVLFLVDFSTYRVVPAGSKAARQTSQTTAWALTRIDAPVNHLIVPLYYAVCRVEAEILSLPPPPLINYNPTASAAPHLSACKKRNWVPNVCPLGCLGLICERRESQFT